MLASLQAGYLETGRYTSDAKALAQQTVLSMVTTGAAVAGTVASAAFSSSLFMATAAPASLMQLSGGVGSAVMGATGIVGHAPFVAVAGSLPVVAPLMAMQAINAAIMLQQFKRVDQKLDAIMHQLDELVAREEATITAELLSAAAIADEVYKQYEVAGQFSHDMLIRLALAERDVRRVALRARFLVEAHTVESITDARSVDRANYDAQSAMLASFLELRIAYLRLCVDMQENPKAVPGSVEELKKNLGSGTEQWRKLLNRSADFFAEAERLKSESVGKKLANNKRIAVLESAYTTTMASEKKINEGFDALIQDATRTLEELKVPASSAAKPPTLLYWEDEAGTHSMYTHQLPLTIASS